MNRIEVFQPIFDSVMKGSSCRRLSQYTQLKTRANTRKIAILLGRIANFCDFSQEKFWGKNSVIVVGGFSKS